MTYGELTDFSINGPTRLPYLQHALSTQQDGTLSSISSSDPTEQSTEVDLCHPKRCRSFLLCEHCDRCVCNSTYYHQKEAYFNHMTGQWQQGDDTELESEDIESLGSEGNHYEGTQILC